MQQNMQHVLSSVCEDTEQQESRHPILPWAYKPLQHITATIPQVVAGAEEQLGKWLQHHTPSHVVSRPPRAASAFGTHGSMAEMQDMQASTKV